MRDKRFALCQDIIEALLSAICPQAGGTPISSDRETSGVFAQRQSCRLSDAVQVALYKSLLEGRAMRQQARRTQGQQRLSA